MFNNTKQGQGLKKMEKEQEQVWEEAKAQSIPLAIEILKIILEEKVPFEALNEGKRPEEAQKANKRIQELFLEKDIEFQRRHLPFQLAMAPLEYVKSCVLADLETSYERYLTKLIGVETYADMKFSDLDKAIKKLNEGDA
jgi:hypothetical protein